MSHTPTCRHPSGLLLPTVFLEIPYFIHMSKAARKSGTAVPRLATARPAADTVTAIPFQCTMCLSPFDDGNHAPRRTPCCRRLLCGKCAYVVVSHPTPPPCCFCGEVPSSSLEMASFPTDVGIMDGALASSSKPVEYVQS